VVKTEHKEFSQNLKACPFKISGGAKKIYDF
jgi:hypothetical protein